MAKRRAFNPEFKARIFLQLLTGTKTAAKICREHQLSEQLLTSWKRQLLARADPVFAQEAVSRSAFYYRSAEADESWLRGAVNQLAAQFPTYGSRRLAAQLRRAP
jgi:transposase-like protein